MRLTRDNEMTPSSPSSTPSTYLRQGTHTSCERTLRKLKVKAALNLAPFWHVRKAS